MVLLKEQKEPPDEEKVGFPRKAGLPGGVNGTSRWREGGVSQEGWSPPGSGGNLPMGRRWGFSGRLVSPKEQKEPHGGEKVGSLGRESPSGS
ncbi:unnamed protein product [Sphagnum balticum]